MTDLLAILEQIRALPEVSAFQFGFVKPEEEDLVQAPTFEWQAMLNGHRYEGTIVIARADVSALTLAAGALASLQRGIADAKRHSEEG